MSPRTVSVFSLPARLSAKADPALIEADDHHLTRVADEIAGQVSGLSDRLRELRLAPGGSGRAALDRDLEIHRLSARLTVLRRFGLDVCLGRMVPQDGSAPVYVGRVGVATGQGEPLLVDWRAPAAEPFFAATGAQPLGLVSRRRYRWSDGRIVDYWDEAFLAGADGLALDDDSGFIASLGASRSARMRDVLATIQADQDQIIRAGSAGALVVDGGPGTGKTVAALHRAAYLLYADPRLRGQRGSVLVVGPNRHYLRYVADVLPSLGEDGVQTCTLADLVAWAGQAAPEPDPEVARLKGSARMVEAVGPAVGLYEEVPRQPVLIETDWVDVRLTGQDWQEAFDTVDPGTPHNEARDEIWEALLEIAVDKAAGPDIPRAALRRSLAAHDDLRDLFGRTWPLLEASDLVSDLWSVPAYLKRCAPWLSPEERGRLKRPEGSPWTTADLPLLDAMRDRLGDRKAAGQRRREQAELAQDRAYMDQVVDNLLSADDDPESGLSLLRRDSIRDDLLHREALAPVSRDRLVGPFAHVIVDEAQELTDAEWQVLLRRCPSRSFTIVGDRAQARHGFAESWQRRLARLGFEEVREQTLTVNYRTPREVMRQAEPVIRAVLPDANVPTSIRSGGAPVHHGSITELDGLLTRWLAGHEEGIVAVVGDPDFAPGDDRVRVLDPVEVKGLEFDLVVLIDPEEFGDGVTGAVDRYVAMTRATQQLVVLRQQPGQAVTSPAG